MTINVANGAAQHIPLGIKDESTKKVDRLPPPIPQHLPKCFFMSSRGKYGPQLLNPEDVAIAYGDKPFTAGHIYNNHAAFGAQQAMKHGNAIMGERVKLRGAKKSTLLISVLIEETDIDVQDRLPTGEIDPAGNTTTESGIKLSFTTTNVDMDDPAFKDAPAAAVGNKTRYPLIAIPAAWEGDDGRTIGARFWGPTLDDPYDQKILDQENVVPFFVGMMERDSEFSLRARPAPSNNGAIQGVATLLKGVTHPLTNQSLYLPDVLDAMYNSNDPQLESIDTNIDTVFVFDNHVKTVYELLATTEGANEEMWADTMDESTPHRFNLFGLRTVNNAPYKFVQYDIANQIVFNSKTTHYLQGGADFDGTGDPGANPPIPDISIYQAYEEGVISALAGYTDKNNELMDTAVNVESWLYDTGFSIPAKFAISDAIRYRKDIMVGLATFEDPDYSTSISPRSPAEEQSIGQVLAARLRGMPESTFFGTPTVRACIFGYNGKMLNSPYIKRTSIIQNFISKAAEWWGAGNGKWKGGRNFDGGQGAQLNEMYDFNVSWVPVNMRVKHYDAGINYPLRSGPKQMFFPQYKTVYLYPTSVLNSIPSAMVCVTLEKIVDQAWREHTGISGLTNDQMVQRVERFLINRLNYYTFNNRYTVIPRVTIDGIDAQEGYSWSVAMEHYSPGEKSVQKSQIISRRIEDLEG